MEFGQLGVIGQFVVKHAMVESVLVTELAPLYRVTVDAVMDYQNKLKDAMFNLVIK
jgi:hypothetical protein